MNLEKTLFYFTHHVESIIQWLFVTILALSAFIIARSLFGSKEAAAGHVGTSDLQGPGHEEIRGFLEKIIDQTAKLSSVTVATMDPSSASAVDAQVQALKKELELRLEEIAKLKAAGGGGDAKTSAVADDAAARIKELESKLAEYEILEDDIADLSLYKEENARLRAELDKAKTTAASSPPVTASAAQPQVEAAASPEAPAIASLGEDIVAEFAQAVSQETTVPSSSPPLDAPKTDNPLADFESAVNLEKKMGGESAPAAAVTAQAPAPTAAAAVAEPTPVEAASPPPQPILTPAPMPTPVAAEPILETANGEGDDLFAEFAQPPVESAEAALDTEKMLAEMAALVAVDATEGSALHDEIDTEKMAAEATHLVKS